jgi:hypothetical protein
MEIVDCKALNILRVDEDVVINRAVDQLKAHLQELYSSGMCGEWQDGD